MFRWCWCLAPLVPLIALAQFKLPVVATPPPKTYHLTFELDWGDISMTSYGVIVITNGQPATYSERIVTTRISNADFIVSNLPPSIDAIRAFGVFRNGALSWTNGPAVTKWMVLYEDNQLATNAVESKSLYGPWVPLQTNQFVPTNDLRWFRSTNRITLSNFNAGVFLQRD